MNLVILALGVYRLWILIAEDTITQGFRQRILGYDDDGKRNRWPNPHKRLAEFVHCPWCSAFWVGLVVWLAYCEWPHATPMVLAPFALSAAVALLAVTFKRIVLEGD